MGMVYERPDCLKIKKYSRAKAHRDGCVDCCGGIKKGEIRNWVCIDAMAGAVLGNGRLTGDEVEDQLGEVWAP